MSLASYADIREQVARWLDRPDVGDFIPDFIALAENRLNRALCDNVNLVAKTTLTFSSGTHSLPDDFNGVVSVSGGLAFKPVAEFARLNPAFGPPLYYTVAAGQINVWPAPRDPTSVTLRYRTKIDALRFGPNWLLDTHPDAYLYGALVEAAGFVAGEARASQWEARFEAIMADINSQAQGLAFGGPLQVTSCGGE